MIYVQNKAHTALAIDLALDAVRVLDIKFSRGAPAVKAFASQSVIHRPGHAPDSLPETPPQRRLAASLAGNTHRLKTRRCVAAMPTSLVVITRSP